MTAPPTMTIYSDLPHESLDHRVLVVIEEIDDDETYQRIVHNISCGLDMEDVLLIASMMNRFFPPTNRFDVAECHGDDKFTVIVNSDTHKLEWEADSTRFHEAGEWFEGDNAFGYRPPDRILVTALQFDGTYIRFIDSPTEGMKMAAVERSSAAIEYIKNPSDAVRQLAAARATTERAQDRAALARKRGPNVAPTR